MKLGVFATHPIQYQAPIWRRLAATPGCEVTVHYFSDHSVRGGRDPDFGIGVSWDVDLLGGYPSVFLTRAADFTRPGAVRFPDAAAVLGPGRFDWVYLAGYTHGFERQLVRLKARYGYRLLMRGEFSDERPGCGAGLRGRLQSAARDLYLKWFYRHIDAFGVIGTAAQHHLNRLGVARQRQFASPYNVDSDLFEAQRRHFSREACRTELGLAPDGFVVLFSGKFIARKAPLDLAEAVATLTRSQPRLTLIMLGDGELRAPLERRFRPLLGERLVLPGFVNQSHLGRYFAAADAFVLPSAFETWGLVVNEAMQFGLPVVVSDRVGCRHDLVTPEVTGEVFPYGNVEALAGKVEALASDPQRTRRMGQAARERVAGFTVEQAAAGLLRAMNVTGSGQGESACLRRVDGSASRLAPVSQRGTD